MAAENYSASSLTVLEGLDAVRKRPGMYIGSTDSRGLQHCLWEIVDNAVDEALAGHCRTIDVILHPDGSAEVVDDGRGIPVDVDVRSGLSGVELVFTKLHAGGKFGGGGYSVSGGLHGVGASVVNALSERVDVEVVRSGRLHTLSFSHGSAGSFSRSGVFSTGLLRDSGSTKRSRGTRIVFWPDRAIFTPEASFDWDLVTSRARQTAFLVPGLSIRVSEPAVGREESFCFDGGTVDFVEFLAPDGPACPPVRVSGSGSFVETVPVLEGDRLVSREVERICEVDVAFRWGTGYETTIRSFVNVIATPNGGTHMVGFERSLVKSMVAACRDLKAVRASEENPSKEDVLEGLSAVVLVRLAEPQFEGQTKETLGTPAVQRVVADAVSAALSSWAERKRSRADARKVCDKIANAARARRAARAQRDTVRRKNALESSSLPSKLSDCRSSGAMDSELFIIEGDSAGGTVKAARDSEFQALLPIRGKILNTMRATEKQMLDNAECASIISAVGAGSGQSFDLSNARYGKLIVLADADVDGSHIRCLLLTLAFRYMRPMLEAGRIFAAVPPLYRVEASGAESFFYCYSDVERDEVLARLERTKRKVKEVQRFKGLGEMDAEQLAETTLEVGSRSLRRMTMVDAREAEQVFERLMGKDVPARREFIVTNSRAMDRSRIDA